MRLAGGGQVDRATQPVATAREGADALAAPSVERSLGDFDPRIVAMRIRGEATRIKRCYERELARDPTLRGTVRVEFTIMPDGQVVAVNATENSVSPVVGECVVEVLDALTFSPGPVGGSVRYRFPFVFEHGN